MASTAKGASNGGSGGEGRGRLQLGTPVPVGNLVLPPGVSFNRRKNSSEARARALRRERERSAREMRAETQDLLVTNFITSGLRTGSTRVALDATTTRPRADARSGEGAASSSDEASTSPDAPPPVESMADAVNATAVRRLTGLLQKRGIRATTERVRQVIEGSPQGRMLMMNYIEATMAPTIRPRARGVTTEVLALLSESSNVNQSQRSILAYLTRELRTYTTSYRR